MDTTYAFERASERRGQVTSATKSNGIIHTMPFWDEVVADVGARFPSASLRSVLIDALAAEAGPVSIERSDDTADPALRGAARAALQTVFDAPGAWITDRTHPTGKAS